jgi:hypothetical protein
LRVDQLKQRFETSRLIGKMLLTVIEAPADFLNQDGAEIVKALVGHDEMKGERKNVNESLRVQGRYPIVVTSNERAARSSSRRRVGLGPTTLKC